MAAWRRRGGIEVFQRKLFEGMRRNGYSEAFAGRIFEQIRGFSEYGFPESHAASFALLAYVSDFHLVGTATLPHGISWIGGNLMLASLDHAMWFHRDFRMDRWLLHTMDSPSSSQARGLSRGAFYQDGKLVASVIQEGMNLQRPLASPEFGPLKHGKTQRDRARIQ